MIVKPVCMAPLPEPHYFVTIRASACGQGTMYQEIMNIFLLLTKRQSILKDGQSTPSMDRS